MYFHICDVHTTFSFGTNLNYSLWWYNVKDEHVNCDT